MAARSHGAATAAAILQSIGAHPVGEGAESAEEEELMEEPPPMPELSGGGGNAQGC